MAVAPSHRGRGLAAELLVEADARARELDAQRIALAAQLSAQALYERAGYARTATYSSTRASST